MLNSSPYAIMRVIDVVPTASFGAAHSVVFAGSSTFSLSHLSTAPSGW
jgi:hypothetical protein